MQRYAPFEQIVLRRSIWATVFIGAFSIVFGLLISSSSIIFDGIFSSIDAAMTIVALQVTRLVGSETTPRFQRGFWHMEPIILFLNGGTLIVLCFYAFIESISTILQGGNRTAFDWAAVYVLLLCVACFAMMIYERRVNRRIQSEFIKIDALNWLVTALISLALLLAFACTYLMENTRFERYTPYVDPAILLALSAVMIFMPLSTVRKAVREILLMTPERMDLRVREIMDRMQEKYGFADYASYVVKVGRARFIELHIVLPESFPIPSITALDAIRADISQEIGGAGPHRWITVSFTGDEAWI